MLKTLIIIPAYNEELNIQKTIDDIKENAPEVDYVVVNDGSMDNTLDVLNKYNFHYINGFQNQGLFGAVQTGFRWALLNNYIAVLQFSITTEMLLFNLMVMDSIQPLILSC